MDVRVDCTESWAPKNWCFWTVVLEKTLESPLDCKEIQPVHPKGNQSWIFTGRTDAETQTPILWPHEAKNWLIWKKPWCWAKLKAGGKGDDRAWDGWMASLPRWTLVWVSSRSWWWTGKPIMLQSMGSQRVSHDWVTELNWTGKGLSYTYRCIYSPPNYLGWAVLKTGAVWVGLPCDSVIKNLPAKTRDGSSIPGLGRSPGEEKGSSLQYSCLGNPMDRGTWPPTIHGLQKVYLATEHTHTQIRKHTI